MTEKVIHPARGKTWYGPTQTIDTNNYEATHLEGHTVEFPHTDPSNQTVRLDSRPVIMRLMRNVSGVTLYAGMMVASKSGYEQKRFDGLARTTACEIAGVIDDHLGSGGVRNGDLCWVHVQGPAKVYTAYTASKLGDVSVGSLLYAITVATSNVTTNDAGRFQAWCGTFTATQTTDGTGAAILLNHFGRALSACTSANTNTLKLVDMRLPI